MVFKHQREYDSQWGAMASIAAKISCMAETLRKWIRQGDRDAGLRGGLTTDEKQRMKELEREVRELNARPAGGVRVAAALPFVARS